MTRVTEVEDVVSGIGDLAGHSEGFSDGSPLKMIACNQGAAPTPPVGTGLAGAALVVDVGFTWLSVLTHTLQKRVHRFDTL
jgi:hypothetical protein